MVMGRQITLEDITDEVNQITQIELWAAKDPIKTDYHARQYIREFLEPYVYTCGMNNRLLMRGEHWIHAFDILLRGIESNYNTRAHKMIKKRWLFYDRPRVTAGWEEYQDEEEE